MSRLFLAVLLPLILIACAEEATPEENEDPATEQAATPDADASGVSTQAKPLKCTDNSDGTTTCCSKTACTTF
jgi:PBP1b-binding outer membrane lipoprotein LpoB